MAAASSTMKIYLNIVVLFLIFIFPTASYGDYANNYRRSSKSNPPIIFLIDYNARQNHGNGKHSHVHRYDNLDPDHNARYDKPSLDVSDLLANLFSYKSSSSGKNQYKKPKYNNRYDDNYNRHRNSNYYKNSQNNDYNRPPVNRDQYKNRNDYGSNRYDRNYRYNDRNSDVSYNSNYRPYGSSNRYDNDNYVNNYRGNSRFQDRNEINRNRYNNNRYRGDREYRYRDNNKNDRYSYNYDRNDRYTSQNYNYRDLDRDNRYDNYRNRDDDRYNRLDNENEDAPLAKALLRISNDMRANSCEDEPNEKSCEEKMTPPTEDPCEVNNSCEEDDDNISTRGIPSEYVSEIPPNCCK